MSDTNPTSEASHPGGGAPPDDDRRQLARGALLKGADALAGGLRAAVPMVFLRLYSDQAYGVYVVAFALVEMVQRGIVTGFTDALVYVAARHDGAARVSTGEARAAAERALARALATALVVSGGLSLGGLALIELGAGLVHSLAYASTQPASLVPALRLMALLLPLHLLLSLPLAALRARCQIQYELLVQSILHPLVVLGLAFGLRKCSDSPLAPVAAWVGGTAIAAAVACIAFERVFGKTRPLLAALYRFSPDRELVAYALPQSANLFANFGLERVSPLLLGAFAAPATVAHYAVASEVARLLRTLRISLSGVFGPMVARQLGAGRRGGIQPAYSLVTGWIAIGTLPALFVLLGLRREVFLLYDQPAPGAFFVVLLLATFLNGAYGLSGTVLLMTGRSGWMLAISAASAVVNVALGLTLVPRMGLLGASLASSAAMLVQVIAQQSFARRLEGLRQPRGAWAAPLVGGVALLLALLGLGLLPAAVSDGRLLTGPLVGRVLVAAGGLGAYAALVRTVSRRRAERSPGAARPSAVVI